MGSLRGSRTFGRAALLPGFRRGAATMGMVAPVYYSVDMVRALPADGHRYEVVLGGLLVGEVLSPSLARADRFTKRRLYQERRILTYWVVDGDEHLAEVWTASVDLPVVERERLLWHPAGAGEPVTVELRELFAPI